MSGQLLSHWFQRIPFVGHPYEEVPAGPPRHLPRREPTHSSPGFEELPEPLGPRLLGRGITLLRHHPAPRPPGADGLVVMTFNILLGGQRRELLEQYFAALEEQGRMPDVIGLQEACQPTAVAFARRHGFHLAYFGQDGAGEERLVNGKAMLSRHPIREAVHFTYDIPEPVRGDAIARRGEPGELVEDRGALRVLLDVHGQPVVVYNIHHSLGDTGINASQLQQLITLVREHHGTPTLVLGDFNANTNIRRETSWKPAVLRRHEHTHTDSIDSYQARYGIVHASVGDWGVGNIADPRIRRSFHALERLAPDTLIQAQRVHVRRPDGSLMTPEEARQRLESGKGVKDSEEWRRLEDVADLSTLNSLPDETGVVPATGKRFDIIYASRELDPRLLEVDHSTDSSDHLPVIAHFHWRAHRA